ncbi:hypothetical protein HHL28_06140 [Aerophototrophica crusticola]|uniref:Uncharacterized protein n=1 Tax=Aerophototrophica crusticola TaxID=1709002 RepID=A0A858R6Q5_9PROT|nr:hypothetical protein HHL28_06140 [Rhodospirillaceae bacterium B3]
MAGERQSPRESGMVAEGSGKVPAREAEAASLSPGRRGGGAPAAGPSAKDQETLADILDRTSRDLSESRRQVDELRQKLDEAQQQRLEDAKELAEVRRRSAGLQFRVDYLEEKLDQAKRALAPAKKSWWKK